MKCRLVLVGSHSRLLAVSDAFAFAVSVVVAVTVAVSVAVAVIAAVSVAFAVAFAISTHVIAHTSGLLRYSLLLAHDNRHCTLVDQLQHHGVLSNPHVLRRCCLLVACSVPSTLVA